MAVTKKNPPNKVSAIFQGIAFLITFICLSLLFTARYHIFITHDPYPTLIENPQSEKKVIVGLHVAHFNDFDLPNNKFSLDGMLWFLFNPNEVSLDTIKKFDVFNGTILDKSDPVIIQHNDSHIAQFRIRTKFQTALNYRIFPLDDHRVNLIIDNRFLPDDVVFNSTNKDITFADSTYLQGWKIVEASIRTGIQEVVLERDNKRYVNQQKEAIITFNCERTDPSIIIDLMLTLILMIFLAMLTFSSEEDSVLIVSVGIVAIIGYRSFMQSVSPPQVGYFMFADYMYLFALVCVIATLFAGIVTRDRDSSAKVKKYIIGGIYALFILACTIVSLLS